MKELSLTIKILPCVFQSKVGITRFQIGANNRLLEFQKGSIPTERIRDLLRGYRHSRKMKHTILANQAVLTVAKSESTDDSDQYPVALSRK